MSKATTTTAGALKVSGTGLITGLPVEVSIEQLPAGSGIVFDLGEGVMIPARLEAVVHTERGISLGHPSQKTLSIVEHFLCACSLCGLNDLMVQVVGAPELPLLDGSSIQWVEALSNHFGRESIEPKIELSEPLHYQHSETIAIHAEPAEHLKVTYTIDFDHPDLKNAEFYWDSLNDGIEAIAPARTFGYLRELPILQAKGLAKGVSLENTLGLTDEGGYTSPLRMAQEPLRHKVIDLLGDLTLSGINPLSLKVHIHAVQAGHNSHTAFAKKLLEKIMPC